MVDVADKPIRRPLRFALPMVCLALAALGGWIAWSANQVRERNALLVEIELADGSVVFADDSGRSGAIKENLPVLWRVWGAKPVRWLLLPDEGFGEADRARIRKLFPEARVGPLSRGRGRSE